MYVSVFANTNHDDLNYPSLSLFIGRGDRYKLVCWNE